MFYDNYVKFCVSVGKKPSAVALDIGLNKSTVSNWKNRGTSPTDATAQRIADYFGIPVSELLGTADSTPDAGWLIDLPLSSAEKVKMRREQLGLSIATVASCCNLSEDEIIAIESGTKSPTHYDLTNFTNILRASTECFADKSPKGKEPAPLSENELDYDKWLNSLSQDELLKVIAKATQALQERNK